MAKEEAIKQRLAAAKMPTESTPIMVQRSRAEDTLFTHAVEDIELLLRVVRAVREQVAIDGAMPELSEALAVLNAEETP